MTFRQMVVRCLLKTFPPIRRLYEHRNALIEERDQLSNQRIVAAKSPFWIYNTCFDAVSLMKAYQAPDPAYLPGHVTNFLGVHTATRFFPGILGGREGSVEDIPLPANWHADIAEWGAALRAVELSGPVFTVLELGCGWGCWMNNMGVAARRAGKNVHVIGIEGDPDHVRFAEDSLKTNGFSSNQITLFHGIVSERGGQALFPAQELGGVSWGLEPLFDVSPEDCQAAVDARTHVAVPVFSLKDLIPPNSRIDLLHIDIQGGEADLVVECLDVMTRSVAYMVIGTHSREIEGRIFKILLDAGWKLEIERPCIITLDGSLPHTVVDGVQGWRNLQI